MSPQRVGDKISVLETKGWLPGAGAEGGGDCKGTGRNLLAGNGAVLLPDLVMTTQIHASDDIFEDHAHNRKCMWELVKSQ